MQGPYIIKLTIGYQKIKTTKFIFQTLSHLLPLNQIKTNHYVSLHTHLQTHPPPRSSSAASRSYAPPTWRSRAAAVVASWVVHSHPRSPRLFPRRPGQPGESAAGASGRDARTRGCRRTRRRRTAPPCASSWRPSGRDLDCIGWFSLVGWVDNLIELLV